MTGPQLEDGFFRVANELAEALALADLSRRQHKIIWAVARETYGYNRKASVISIWSIAKKTGLSHQNASREVSAMIKRHILTRSDGEVVRGQSVHKLGINKNYREWLDPQQPVEGDPQQNIPPTKQHGCQNIGGHPQQPVEGDPQQIGTHSKNNKNKKTNIAHSSFGQFYSAYPLKVGKKHALKAFVRLNPDEALLSQMLSAIEKQKQARAQKEKRGIWVPEWKHPATWINAGSWDDEVHDVKPTPKRVVV